MELTCAIDDLETTVYRGSPYSIVAGPLGILSRFVVREREKHRIATPSERKRFNLRETVKQLYGMVRLLMGMFVRQKLMQVWGPVLGWEYTRNKLLLVNLIRKIKSRRIGKVRGKL